ncbi:hypothetical protein HOD88_00730 [archaeon]|jgi:ribosomal RNA assembly protein|nr:hypothetical protein [archaeon]
MIKILSEQIGRIIKSKKRLEETLNLKITNRGKEVSIVGSPEDEYIGQKVIDAINFGFLTSTALLIKTEENVFEILDIKNYTKRKDMKTIRGRLIGTGGRTLKTLTDLSNSHVELKDNQLGIIAPAENIEAIQNGIILIIQGSKQTNIYSFLEKNRPKPVEDLGLK